MDSFYQFYSKISGAGAELTPLTDKDFARYGSEDVKNHIEDLKRKGFNPMKLGKPMSDEEFQKYHYWGNDPLENGMPKD